MFKSRIYISGKERKEREDSKKKKKNSMRKKKSSRKKENKNDAKDDKVDYKRFIFVPIIRKECASKVDIQIPS